MDTSTSNHDQQDIASIPIIDSHIHLFPASELKSLSWNSPGNPLWSQHTVPEYLAAVNHPIRTDSEPNLKGFVFLETDRKTHLTDIKAWTTGPLLELKYLISIANGTPSKEDGFHPEGAKLLLGIIPWAPIPAGISTLKDYISRAKTISGDKWHLVKGFRYLLQDKPSGTMLQDDFIAGLKFLGTEQFVFDLGIDFRSGGAWQLDEAAEMLELVTQGVPKEEQVRIVVNHMCKPPMDGDEDPRNATGRVKEWETRLNTIAKFGNTVVKVSGGFSEIKPLPRASTAHDWIETGQVEDALLAATEKIEHFIDTTWKAFGIERMMFASDWPVCNIGGGGPETAWHNWYQVVAKWCDRRGLSKEDLEKLFWKTAQKAYNIP